MGFRAGKTPEVRNKYINAIKNGKIKFALQVENYLLLPFMFLNNKFFMTTESMDNDKIKTQSIDANLEVAVVKVKKAKIVAKRVNPFPNPFKNNAGGKGPKQNAPTFRIRKSLSGKS